MEQRDRYAALSLLVLMLTLWLGFLVHRSPRFAGSAAGGALGIAAGILMLLPLGYSIVKRVPGIRTRVTKRLSLSVLLAWHVYLGIAGALLALLHTGHKFDSLLGISLTVSMFAVVLSGYIGRYYLRFAAHELSEKRKVRDEIEALLRQTASELAQKPDSLITAAAGRGLRGLVTSLFLLPATESSREAENVAWRAVRLTEALADVEHAIGSHDALKRTFGRWLWFHIAASVLFYVLLGLHVWSGVYFGLRWAQ